MNTLKLVIIDSNYCDYLRGFDSKVAYNYAKKDTRPFIGVLFNVGNMEYFAPLYSPKPKHLTMKDNVVFLKIDNGNLGVINFNNMIPVTPNNYIIPNLKKKSFNMQELQYQFLLLSQLNWLNRNVHLVKNKAQNLYNRYSNNKLPTNIMNRCCNFKLLEQACANYNKKLVNTP